MVTFSLLASRLHEPGPPIVELDPVQRVALDRVRRRIADGTYRFEIAACECGESRSLILGRRDRYGLAVKTHLCRRCGLLRTSPRCRIDERIIMSIFPPLSTRQVLRSRNTAG